MHLPPGRRCWPPSRSSPAVSARRGRGLGELDADVAGQVLRGRDQPLRLAPESANTSPAERRAGVLLGAAEQPGDLVQVDPAVGVQADRDARPPAVSAPSRGVRGATTRSVKMAAFSAGAGAGVVVLQGVDGGGVRVGPEAALRRADAGQPVFAGVRVDAAGAAVG